MHDHDQLVSDYCKSQKGWGKNSQPGKRCSLAALQNSPQPVFATFAVLLAWYLWYIVNVHAYTPSPPLSMHTYTHTHTLTHTHIHTHARTHTHSFTHTKIHNTNNTPLNPTHWLQEAREMAASSQVSAEGMQQQQQQQQQGPAEGKRQEGKALGFGGAGSLEEQIALQVCWRSGVVFCAHVCVGAFVWWCVCWCVCVMVCVMVCVLCVCEHFLVHEGIFDDIHIVWSGSLVPVLVLHLNHDALYLGLA
jgi:hypothetical protein